MTLGFLSLTVRQEFAAGGLARRTLEGFTVSWWDLPHPHVAVTCPRQQHRGTGMPLQPLRRKQSRQPQFNRYCSYTLLTQAQTKNTHSLSQSPLPQDRILRKTRSPSWFPLSKLWWCRSCPRWPPSRSRGWTWHTSQSLRALLDTKKGFWFQLSITSLYFVSLSHYIGSNNCLCLLFKN